MTAMLSISAAFVSCSNKELYDPSAVEQAKVLDTEKHDIQDLPFLPWGRKKPALTGTDRAGRDRFSDSPGRLSLS